MSKKQRRTLTAKELEWAANARSYWDDKKRAEKVTQEDANNALGWSPSSFGQYINGKIPLNLQALFKIAAYLDVNPEDISDTLCGQLDVDNESDAVKEAAAKYWRNIAESFKESETPEDIFRQLGREKAIQVVASIIKKWPREDRIAIARAALEED